MPSLSVKYRPNDFNEIVGQEVITKILNQQLQTGKIKNTYLFCGASGCGKTTAARAFIRKLNNSDNSAIEIDGASNNGVDNVRTIIADAKERSTSFEYKCFIIDECHMLSTAAWNAFLKCIEEPPKYTIFIFCTTDPQKIPATILNRCMRFNFNRIPSSLIKGRLCYICEQEHFTNYEEACDYISKICNNQMRDGIALLEKAASYDSNISIQHVFEALGNYSYDYMIRLLDYINHKAEGMSLELINELYFSGADLKLFIDKFLSFCLDVVKYLIIHSFDITKLPISIKPNVDNILSEYHDIQYYNNIITLILDTKNMIKTDSDIKSTIEVMMIRMCSHD